MHMVNSTKSAPTLQPAARTDAIPSAKTSGGTERTVAAMQVRGKSNIAAKPLAAVAAPDRTNAKLREHRERNFIANRLNIGQPSDAIAPRHRMCDNEAFPLRKVGGRIRKLVQLAPAAPKPTQVANNLARPRHEAATNILKQSTQQLGGGLNNSLQKQQPLLPQSAVHADDLVLTTKSVVRHVRNVTAPFLSKDRTLPL